MIELETMLEKEELNKELHTNYSVRMAGKKDIYQIAEVYSKNFKEHILVNRNILTDVKYLEEQISNKGEIWAVVQKNDKIIGVAALAVNTAIGLGEIERVCVDMDSRGNGYALTLGEYLLDNAKQKNLGFVEAFARGDMISMQKTFEKLGMKVYGVAPRFEIMHNNKVVREEFVHMGIVLKPESIDTSSMNLIPNARDIYNMRNKYI